MNPDQSIAIIDNPSPADTALLGEHIYEKFVEAKRSEWQTYIARVHAWEVERYLQAY